MQLQINSINRKWENIDNDFTTESLHYFIECMHNFPTKENLKIYSEFFKSFKSRLGINNRSFEGISGMSISELSLGVRLPSNRIMIKLKDALNIDERALYEPFLVIDDNVAKLKLSALDTEYQLINDINHIRRVYDRCQTYMPLDVTNKEKLESFGNKYSVYSPSSKVYNKLLVLIRTRVRLLVLSRNMTIRGCVKECFNTQQKNLIPSSKLSINRLETIAKYLNIPTVALVTAGLEYIDSFGSKKPKTITIVSNKKIKCKCKNGQSDIKSFADNFPMFVALKEIYDDVAQTHDEKVFIGNVMQNYLKEFENK